MGDQETPPSSVSDNANFMGIPLKGWAIGAVSLIAVLYAAGHVGFKLYGDLQQAKKDKQTAEQKAAQAATVNTDTSTYSNAITAEMETHKKDQSGHQVSIHRDQEGEIFAVYFESDGCIAINRPGHPLPYMPNPQPILEWSLGPSKRPALAAPPLATQLGTANPSAGSRVPKTDQHLHNVDSAHLPSQLELWDGRPRLQRIQAGCWNNGPHPWGFNSWWGPANGCWAPLYRQWNDGCTHYQMFNTCYGQWDPRIFWSYCNPQHHP